ncbi:MAG: DUF4393 domain-containing protein [bacterium]|nr:DUF4393 domain-containing protein [bacterium]
MSDTESTSGELIKAGVEVVKTAYDDALQPLAKETGKALGTLGKTVNLALSPLRGLVWSWEQIEDYVSTTVERKLQERKVPDERVQTPDPDIAVPALSALRYSKLREHYAELLATAMDSADANEAHPAFVEILRQLTPDEARIVQALPEVGRHEPLADLDYRDPERGQFTLYRHASTLPTKAECERVESFPQYVDNLCRLGLTEIPAGKALFEGWRYDPIKELDVFHRTKEQVPGNYGLLLVPKMFGLTVLGGSFRYACMRASDENQV